MHFGDIVILFLFVSTLSKEIFCDKETWCTHFVSSSASSFATTSAGFTPNYATISRINLLE